MVGNGFPVRDVLMQTSIRLLLLAALQAGNAAHAAAQPERWVATPIVRAGAVDGPAALAGVFDVEVGPDGAILVGQAGLGARRYTAARRSSSASLRFLPYTR
jgi:hypothetical protein